MSSKEVGVAHKHYPERGGAEVVADELARTFGVPVHTAFDIGGSADDIETIELFDTRLRSIITQNNPLGWMVRDAYYMSAWEQADELAEFDTLITSGMAPMWYVPTDDQTVIRYIHSTPRSAYDRWHDVSDSVLTRVYARITRQLLSHTVPYADVYVANSDLVARRIEKYWGVAREKIRVVYPPVDVGEYTASEGGEYYVALSRLDHNKGFETIIDAFSAHPDKELRIVGDGPDREDLEKKAQKCDNIRFEGYVSERRKQCLLEGAKAGIYAAENEDFGMVPIEYMAAGTPVIGVSEGFTKYQVEHGFSGVLWSRNSEERGANDNLWKAIETFEQHGVEASADELAEVAQQFSVQRFRDEMREVVADARHQAKIIPKFDTESQPTTLERLATDGGGA